ncbi:MAG: response regulator [Elainellaceae cyanobacterium]
MVPPSILVALPLATIADIDAEDRSPVSKRILLIDDEADIHKIIEVSLTLHAEWKLLKALTSDQGIELAKTEQPDAILLDVMMPERDGIETLASLKLLPDTQEIPVIFLTARAQAADRRRFYSLGAKGVIAKPFDPMTLTSQIAGFLSWR